MMYSKKHFLFVFCLMPFLGQAQIPDSTIISHALDSLKKVAEAHMADFQMEAAVEVAAEIKALTVKHFEKKHPAYINACDLEANVYWRMGEYENAISSCEEGLQLQAEKYGKENSKYAGLLHIRGTIFLEMAKYTEAGIDLKECLILREKVLGKQTSAYAMTLNNLANYYSSIGDFEKCLNTHLEAKDIRGAVSGKLSLDYAMSLANLGRTAFQIGQYEKSIDYLLEAKITVETIHGKEHPIITYTVHNLALAYIQLGQYGTAETAFLEALHLIEMAQGKEHPSYSFVLNDLGVLYDILGFSDKALEIFEQSLSLKEKSLGREHNYTLVTLGNLAKIYQENGELQKAEDLYLEVETIYARLYGTEHYEKLVVLNNLANIYLQRNEIEKADSLHRTVLAIRQRKLGENHPDCAQSLMGLGNTLHKAKKLQAAVELFKKALTIYYNSFSNENLPTVKCYQNLTEIYWEMENPNLVAQYTDSLDFILQAHFIQSAKHLSSNELQIRLAEHATTQDFIYAARNMMGQEYDYLSGLSYDDALLYKGMLLENTIALEKSMQIAPDSIRENYLSWKALQRRIAESYTQPTDDRESTLELERRAETLEKKLIRNFAFRTSRDKVGWKEVQAQLKEDEVAIEFIHFSGYDPNPTDSVYYAALILRPGWELPRWVNLFEEQQILPFIETTESRQSEYVAQLLSNKSNHSLYDFLWKPLESHLQGVNRIIYSPSGILHRIPLAAINNNSLETLNDQYELQLVGSTRQILKQEETVENKDYLVSIFGGIQYEMDSIAITSSLKEDNIVYSDNEDLFGESFRSMDSENTSWKYLPWTEVEAKALTLLFQQNQISTHLYTGYNATEEAVNYSRNKESETYILHIATHGYFFPDPQTVTNNNLDPVFKISEHPMIRSGLILAGANHTWTGGSPIGSLEDGILTAYEVSQLNLSNTELVVLSACETGLGDIKGNEGVYGLQRAFKIAGAKYVLMSLWQVPDFQTQELMTAFYTNWLEQKMDIPQAFRTAQQAVKKKRPEAYYWAGFVLVE